MSQFNHQGRLLSKRLILCDLVKQLVNGIHTATTKYYFKSFLNAEIFVHKEFERLKLLVRFSKGSI